MLTTIILSSSLLYELVGPACAKLALTLSKSYDVEEFKKTKNKEDVEAEDIVYNYHYTDETQIPKHDSPYSPNPPPFNLFPRTQANQPSSLYNAPTFSTT